MSNFDHAYLERRQRESLARADVSADPFIAQMHREFAQRYEHELVTDRGAKRPG